MKSAGRFDREQRSRQQALSPEPISELTKLLRDAGAPAPVIEDGDALGTEGEKRPADVIGNAVHVMRIATGEVEIGAEADDGKDPQAKALAQGRKGAR